MIFRDCVFGRFRGTLAVLVMGWVGLVLGPEVVDAQGEILSWGDQVTVGDDEPSDLKAVAAGNGHSLGLKSDGSVVAWGSNSNGQCTLPPPNADFEAVAAGGYHGLGLKSDGSVVAWGWNNSGECNVPSPNADFVAVAGGAHHSLGLKSDGRISATAQARGKDGRARMAT